MPARPQDPQWEWPSGREPRTTVAGVRLGVVWELSPTSASRTKKLNPHLFTKAEWDRTSDRVIERPSQIAKSETSKNGVCLPRWVLPLSWHSYTRTIAAYSKWPLKGLQCPSYWASLEICLVRITQTFSAGKGIQTQAARPSWSPRA